MHRYYELLSTASMDRLDAIRRGDVHPMEAKKALARDLVARFHGSDAANEAERFFEGRFQRRAAHRPTPVRVGTAGDEIWVCQLLKDIGFAPSTSAARRLVGQGAVRVDGQLVDVDFRFRRGTNRLVEVGRRRVAEVTFDDGETAP
jgi:tyrosyl-tRNA synthetase